MPAMRSRVLYLGPLVAAFSRLVLTVTPNADNAACQCLGVDYSDEGSYFIDATEHGDFTFTSEFQGNCTDATISPVLQDEQQHAYKCSPIKSALIGVQQVSTCEIAYERITTGTWKIIMETPQKEWSIAREFKLKAEGGAVTVTVRTTVTASTTVTAIPGQSTAAAEPVTETPEPTTVVPTTPSTNATETLSSVTTTLTTTVTPSTTVISIPSTISVSVPFSNVSTPNFTPTTVVELTTTVVTTLTPVVVRTSTTPTYLTVTWTNTKKQSTTLAQVTITTICKPVVTKTITSTGPANIITSSSTVLKTAVDSVVTSSFSTVKVVTASCIFATTPLPSNAVGTYTVAGSACIGAAPPWISGASTAAGNPFPSASPGDPRAPPWGYYGPPPWITSLWSANGGIPPWVRCTATAPATQPKPTTTTKTTSRRPRDVMTAENVESVDAVANPMAVTTSTDTQTTYTATQWATEYGPSLTLTRLSVQTVTQTITPMAVTLCVSIPDVTQVVDVAGPNRIWVTLITTTTHKIETVSVTSTSFSIYNDIAAATSCWQSGGQFGVS